MFKKKPLVIILIAASAVFLPLVVLAEINRSVLVGSSEVINDNFVNFGEVITVDGQVNGDVILGGSDVTINGQVAGDVLIAAANVTISGEVLGNARIAASTVIIRGTIAKNATILANDLTFTEKGSIGWSLGYLAGSADLKGKVAGNLTGESLSLTLGGQVGSNAQVTVARNNLVLDPGVKIKGDLNYRTQAETAIRPGQVGGVVTHNEIEDVQNQVRKFFVASSYYLKLISLLGLLLVGLLIVAVCPKKVEQIIQEITVKPLTKIAWGVLFLFGIPVAAFILFISIIGAPLGLIALGAYLILVYLSRIFSGLIVGKYVFGLIFKDRTISPTLSLIFGVVILVLASWLPYVGWLIGLTATVFGLAGAILVGFRDIRKENPTTSAKK
ncbi:MAG: polymer-forming cytoskeletal protein [Patescibacteria group bacterium]|nr:polymer-forming cytoskeletal protein [Patescibacteria group bacterium]